MFVKLGPMPVPTDRAVVEETMVHLYYVLRVAFNKQNWALLKFNY